MVASIIITAYNRLELLKRALKNVLNQTYKDYEVIVVDDCSDVALEVPQGVRLIRHIFNKGLSAARNTGIKAAKGTFICTLDDDNELSPDFLSRTIQEIGDYDAVAVGRTIRYKDFSDYVVPKAGKFMSLDWGILFKREVFDKIQYDEALRANEDSDMGLQFYNAGLRMNVLSEPLTIAYDAENPRESLSWPSERELDGMKKFFNKNQHEYTEPKERWCLYRLMARKFYRGGHRLVGLRFMGRGFMFYPNPRSFAHLLFLCLGWKVYDSFMSIEEKVAAKKRLLRD